MERTAVGPSPAPSRKLSVRSSGAPKIAAAARNDAVASGDDARKRVAGGAKVGGTWRSITVSQLQERLDVAG